MPDVEIRITSDNRGRPGMADARADLKALGAEGVKAADAVAAATGRMAEKVEQAQGRVRVAQDAQAAAWERVRVAQQQVDDLRAKGESTTARYTQANERLETALRKLNVTQLAVFQSQDKLRQAEDDWIRAGENAAEGYSTGFRRAGDHLVAAVEAGGVRAVGAAQVIIPGMTLAGSAASAGLVSGFGAGLVGLGLVSAAQTDRVQDQFDGMTDHVAKRAKQISKPFESTLYSIATQAKATWDGLEGGLEDALGRLAPATSRFTGHVSRALLELEPALDPLAAAFSAVLDDLGPRLPGVIRGISEELQTLARAVERNPEALGQFVEAAGEAIEIVLAFATGLTIVNNQLAEWADRATNPFGLFRDQAAEVPPTLVEVQDELSKTKTAQERAADAAEEHARSLEDLVRASDDVVGSNLNLRQAIMTAKDDITSYTEAVREHGRGSREVAEAQLQVEQSVHRLKQAVVDAALADQAATGRKRDLAAANQAARDKMQELANTTSGPLRSALLDQIARLDALIGRLQMVARTYTANVQVRVSQTGRYTGPPVGAQFAFAHGGIAGGGELPSAATGGARGGPVLVNEHRQEAARLPSGDVVALPHGSTVIPNMTQAAMHAGAMNGGWQQPVIVLELHSSGAVADDLLMRAFAEGIRVRGGNVQTVIDEYRG